MSSRRIIGDSIALGVDSVLKWGGDYLTGRSFELISALPIPKGLDWLVVSFGTNPAEKTPAQWADFKPAARRLRSKSDAKFIWIMPALRFSRERELLSSVIAEFDGKGSRNFPVLFTAGPDGIHPASYSTLAANITAIVNRTV